MQNNAAIIPKTPNIIKLGSESLSMENENINKGNEIERFM